MGSRVEEIYTEFLKYFFVIFLIIKLSATGSRQFEPMNPKLLLSTVKLLVFYI